MDKSHLYFYQATVNSVYDGDTVKVDIDLGLKVIVKHESLRLNRINAPEVRGDEREQGLMSRDYLRSRIDNKTVFLQTLKDKKGKYGRYLAEILLEENGELININDEMVEKGFAVYKEY